MAPCRKRTLVHPSYPQPHLLKATPVNDCTQTRPRAFPTTSECSPLANGSSKTGLTRLLCLFLAFAFATNSLEAQRFNLGEKETLYNYKQRRNRIGKYAPDGSLGVIKRSNNKLDFYTPNGSNMNRFSGSLEKPGKSRKNVRIDGLPGDRFSHVAGGPTFVDPRTGSLFMIYHAEVRRSSPRDYYTMLGLAMSNDRKGLRFKDLGVIIKPNIEANQMLFSIDIGGGSFAIVDDYLYVYYRDYMDDGTSAELAVARAPLTELVMNAQIGVLTPFQKYYEGEWNEPGYGGRASPLEVGNPANAWSAVSYNTYLNQFVLLVSEWTPSLPDLYMATSYDGIHWTPRMPIDLDPGEQFYPTIIGMESAPSQSGASFYIYYTDSLLGGWDRWQDARWVRRRVDLLPPNPTLDAESHWPK